MTQTHRQNPRWLSRRGLLQGAAAAAAAVSCHGVAGAAEPEPQVVEQTAAAQAALARAVEYLWSQQADDGGWHSPQYGVLRSGQALTPFVAYALLGTVDSMSSDEFGRFFRVGKFVLERLSKEGAIGLSDPDIAEYPVYSTSYAAMAVNRMQAYRHMLVDEGDVALQRMRAYLAAAQFDESSGFTLRDAAYGGWGFREALKPGQPGHMDLAHTRRALDALALPRFEKQSADAKTKAQAFLRVVQKLPQAAARPQAAAPSSAALAPPPSLSSRDAESRDESIMQDTPAFDGGFYFSPIVLEANKGRQDKASPPHWQSYATATCDGLLALLAAGVRREDERVTAAIAWLGQHTNLDYPQGVPKEHPEPWGEAIRFYHYAVRAEVFRKLEWPADERLRLATAVSAKQEPNGSFVNRESALMKEDDPVMCTALAVVALSNCLGNDQ